MKFLFVIAAILCAVKSIPIPTVIEQPGKGLATTEFVADSVLEPWDYEENINTTSSYTETEEEEYDDYDSDYSEYDEEVSAEEIIHMPRINTPEKVSGELHTDITLPCEVYSDIPVTVIFANATSILQMESVGENVTHFEYVIWNLTEAETGIYWCYAVNNAGIDKENFNVTIKVLVKENISTPDHVVFRLVMVSITLLLLGFCYCTECRVMIFLRKQLHLFIGRCGY